LPPAWRSRIPSALRAQEQPARHRRRRPAAALQPGVMIKKESKLVLVDAS